MAKIEHLPQTALAFVGTHHRRLQAHRVGNHLLNHHRVAIQNLAPPVFKQPEQSRISDNAALQRLVQAGAVFTRRQRPENGRVHQHRARLVEGSEQILARHEIDARFPTDGRIHLRQHGRWHLDDIHTSHIDRGQEPGHIADYAAAERNQRCAAICAVLYQLLRQLLQCRKTF